jgi:hypothetical protein
MVCRAISEITKTKTFLCVAPNCDTPELVLPNIKSDTVCRKPSTSTKETFTLIQNSKYTYNWTGNCANTEIILSDTH